MGELHGNGADSWRWWYCPADRVEWAGAAWGRDYCWFCNGPGRLGRSPDWGACRL